MEVKSTQAKKPVEAGNKGEVVGPGHAVTVIEGNVSMAQVGQSLLHPASAKEKKELKLKMDLIKKIYFLSLVGTLVPIGMQYYNQAEEFLDDGAMEGLIYFMVNLGAMVFIGQQCFEYGAGKMKKILHLAILFLTPLFFIQMEVETYLEESPSFVAYDKWYIYYQKGIKEFYFNRDLKKVRFYFLKSIEDLKGKPQSAYLAMKSRIFLTMLESMTGDKIKALKIFNDIWNTYPKGDTHELALVAEGMAHIYLGSEQFDNALPFVQKCMDILKNKKLGDRELLFNCRYEMILIQLNNKEFDEAKALFEKIFAFKGRRKKKINKRLLDLVDKFNDLKQTDFALDTYLALLDRYRDSKDYPPLIHLYDQLGKVYEGKGEKLQADIYYNKREEMKEEEASALAAKENKKGEIKKERE